MPAANHTIAGPRSESENAVSIRCAGEKDRGCAGATAYVPRNTQAVYICPVFFRLPTGQQPVAIVHEVAHALLEPDIIDIAYPEERAYRRLRGDEALKNAASYERFVGEIAKAPQVVEKAPLDVSKDCPWDWRWMIHKAIARAEQWNRMARARSRNIPAAMKELRIKEDSKMVRSVFGWVKYKLASPIQFRCEEECDDAAVYFDPVFGGDLHVCPDWVSEFLSSRDGAAETMLAGLYGYLASVDKRSARSYARIARKLVEWYYAGAVDTTVPPSDHATAASVSEPALEDNA